MYWSGTTAQPRVVDHISYMGRKQDQVSFSPPRQASGGSHGPKLPVSATSPQAAFHFTRLHQLDHLIDAGKDDPDIGFMVRLLALCSLPRTNPGNRLQYKRINGPYKLIMTTTGEFKLPYGNLPRLLLAWICTEAVQKRSRLLVLGRSLSDFMRRLEIYSGSGGSRGERTRLRNQMDRLFHTQIEIIYEDHRVRQFVGSRIVDRGELWWDLKRPHEPVLWHSTIELGEKFYNEILSTPVPLNLNILRALKRSSLGLDLYLWLVYRTFVLDHPLKLSWRKLYRQFGVDPSKMNDKNTLRNFRKDCWRELIKIKTAWPGLNIKRCHGGVNLHPSSPSMPPSHLRPLS